MLSRKDAENLLLVPRSKFQRVPWRTDILMFRKLKEAMGVGGSKDAKGGGRTSKGGDASTSSTIATREITRKANKEDLFTVVTYSILAGEPLITPLAIRAEHTCLRLHCVALAVSDDDLCGVGPCTLGCADSAISDEKFAYWTKKDRKSKKRYSQLLAEVQVNSSDPFTSQSRYL